VPVIDGVKSAMRAMAGTVYGASPYFLSHLRGKVLILMYHRVIPRHELETAFVQPGMYVTPETFETHLKFLTAHFHILSLEEALARWQQGTWEDSVRYCVITFDDGWIDNYQYAYPLLRAYHAPAAIFLPTEFIGSNKWLWWDRLGYLLTRTRTAQTKSLPDDLDSVIERAKRIPDEAREAIIDDIATLIDARPPHVRRFINWDEAREMSQSGISFGSHTATHAILTGLEPAALERELRRPLETLRAERVNSAPVLCYPNGNHSSFVVRSARAAGYIAAITTTAGAESATPADLFRLRRVGVHDDITRSTPLFTFHLARQTWSS
jgi:peptidoglycan/xylan/chitin deacetylase (PgdA/CDA1 family)